MSADAIGAIVDLQRHPLAEDGNSVIEAAA